MKAFGWIAVAMVVGSGWFLGCGAASSNPEGTDTPVQPETADVTGPDGSTQPDTPADTAVVPDGGQDTAEPLTVDTQASRTDVQPGEQIDVVCTVAPAAMADKVDTEVQVSGGPEGGASVSGHTVTFDAAGSYAVACAIVGQDVVDTTPVGVTVTFVGPSRVDTTVEPNPVTAGETATVSCQAFDHNDEPVAWDDFVLAVEGPPGAEVDGMMFSSTKVGTYTVACVARTADGQVSDDSPVELVVVNAPLARTVAEVADEQLPAGQSTTVTCTAYDAYDHPLSGYEFELTTDENLTVDGLTVSGTVIGEYDIACTIRYVDDPYDQQSATLEIVAGAPVGLTLGVNPDKDFYGIGNQVTLTPQAVDNYGNVISGDVAAAPVQVDPQAGIEAVTGQPNRFRFLAEGTYTFSTALVDNPSITASVMLTCDQNGPIVTIEYPERGATLDGDQIVMVTGSVHESISGLAQFTINGQAVTVRPDDTFSYPLTSHQGMNLIAASASDGAGHETKTFRSYYYSTQWYPVDLNDPASAFVPNAIKAFLGAQVIDSADPQAVDLAGIFEQVMASLDLLSLIPSPATEQGFLWCTYAIYVTDLNYGPPSVSLTPMDGGLHVYIDIPDFSADILGYSDDFLCPDIVGLATATSLTITADLFIQASPGGQATASMQNVDVVFNELDIQLQGEDNFGEDLLAWILDGLLGLFQDTITGLIEDQFETTIADQFNQMVGDLFAALNLDQTIAVPPFIGEGPGTELHLKTLVNTIQFSSVGGIIAMDGAMLAPKTIDRNPLGSIGRAFCLGPYETFDLPLWGPGGAPLAQIQAGIFYDFVNEALFSLWWGGALELTVSAADLGDVDLSQYGISNLSLVTHFLLPPMMTSCNSDGQFVIQLGDAHIDMVFDFALLGHVDMGFYLFAEIAADLVVVEGETGPAIKVELGDFRILELDVDRINEEQASRKDQLVGIIKGAVPTLLTQQLGESLQFAIPSFDLGSFSEDLPDGMWLTFRPEVIMQESGYLLLGGNLAPGVPAEEGSSCSGGCDTAPRHPLSILPLLAVGLLAVLLRVFGRRRASRRSR